MTLDYDTLGYVTSSKYRETVALALRDGPQTPSDLADCTDIDMAHISRALGQLRDRDLTELLVDEDTHKGRYYGLTHDGEEIAAAVADRESAS